LPLPLHTQSRTTTTTTTHVPPSLCHAGQAVVFSIPVVDAVPVLVPGKLAANEGDEGGVTMTVNYVLCSQRTQHNTTHRTTHSTAQHKLRPLNNPFKCTFQKGRGAGSEPSRQTH
jgi:hypothetical protein